MVWYGEGGEAEKMEGRKGPRVQRTTGAQCCRHDRRSHGKIHLLVIIFDCMNMAKSKSGNKSLKAALLSHQSKAIAAKKKPRPTIHRKFPSLRPTVPFLSTDTILLIGEGNFSFARALLVDPPTHELAQFPPANLTATAFDTEHECYSKYPNAQAIVKTLREKGALVLFGIDATQLEKASALTRPKRTWDRVVWNFPHAGEAGACPV
jgi:25S rRNA (uracil2634-N3)-methyltransferase